MGKLIGIFENIKDVLDIAYYSVNQTTMEQIFQRISKETEEDLENLSKNKSQKSKDDFGKS